MREPERPSVGRLLAAAVAALLLPTVAGFSCGPVPADTAGARLFTSNQVSPLALSADGQVLYVANTTSATVSVLDVSGAGAPALLAEIPVGVDPTGLAVRPKLDPADASEDERVLVANHVSGSLSVVSRARLEVVQTLQPEDADGVRTLVEPAGVAFSGPQRAFVTLDHPNQVAVVDFDAAGAATLHPARLAIAAQGPRAVATGGGKVFVAAFESGNQTEFPTCVALLDARGLDESDPFDEGCEFDVLVDGNRFIFDPNLGGRIIRDRDNPDRDLFVFDAATLQLEEVVEGLGTLHYGLAVSADASRLLLTSTEARNQLDGLVALGNRMFENRLVSLDCAGGCGAGAPTIRDLDAAAGRPVPTPYGVALSANANGAVLTAAGSDGTAGRPGLFTVDAAGNVRGAVETGAIPQGVALRSDANGDPATAFVLNTVDATLSVVDVSDLDAPTVLHTVSVGSDPTPPAVRRGRVAFSTARASTTGTFACESCHPGGHTDQLQWTINTANGPNDGPDPDGEKPEPRTTMPVRGLVGTLPLHWDGTLGDPLAGAFVPGDAAPDCDPAQDGDHACFRHLVDESLAGVMCTPPCDDGGALTPAERDDMAHFLMAVSYPPSPKRRPSDALSSAARQGARDFFTNDDGGGSATILTCGSAGGGCHALPLGAATNSGFVGGFDAPTIRGLWDRFLLFSNGMFQAEEAMALLSAINPGAFGSGQPVWDPAVGHTERGSLLATFPDDPAILQQFGAGFISIYGVRGENIWELVNELGVGLSGQLGRQVTVTAANAADPATAARMDELEQAARDGKVALVAHGAALGSLHYDAAQDAWAGGAGGPLDGAGLRASVDAGGAALTVTAHVPAGVDATTRQPLLWGDVPRPAAGAAGEALLLRSEGVDPAARILVDGAVCGACTLALLDPQDPARTVVTLALAPAGGVHTVQVQNPNGLPSNEVPFVAE